MVCSASCSFRKMLEDMTESDKLMNWFVDHQMELLDVALTQSTFSQVGYCVVAAYVSLISLPC